LSAVDVNCQEGIFPKPTDGNCEKYYHNRQMGSVRNVSKKPKSRQMRAETDVSIKPINEKCFHSQQWKYVSNIFMAGCECENVSTGLTDEKM
jgi:hypothetical protein